MHRFSLSTSFLATLLALALLTPGCNILPDNTYSPSEAEAKFVEFCKKEGGIDVTARQVDRTEWIFLAMNEPIFYLKANHASENTKRKAQPFSLLSLDGSFAQETFRFEYDIVPDVLPADPLTYGYNANEDYTKKRQLIYQGIQEIFFNLSTDEKTKATAPIFFVVVVSDIKKGIAAKNTFYLPDYQALASNAIPVDEYYMRELSDVLGDENLIDDKTGKSLKLEDITYPYFLTTQIKNRIRFKFSHSDFKPQSDPDNEIVSIVANTLRLYPFRSFNSISLLNRRILNPREQREMNFTKEQLKTFEETSASENNKGKVTVIRFPSTNNPPGTKSSGTTTPDNSPSAADQ